jgi:hypothetical protein
LLIFNLLHYNKARSVGQGKLYIGSRRGALAPLPLPPPLLLKERGIKGVRFIKYSDFEVTGLKL